MRYIIIANGPFLPKEIILEAVQEGDIIVALDGAANKLARIGLMPHIIIGDFDSIENLDFWGIPKSFTKNNENKKIEVYKSEKNNVIMVNTPDQNETDLSKAIKFCDLPPSDLGISAATNINILCGLDGRPDHSIGNLRSLNLHFRPDRPIWLHNDAYSLIFIKNMEFTIPAQNLDQKHQVAIMGMPEAAFLSTGLMWDGVATQNDGSDTGPNGYKVYIGHDSTCNLLNEQAKPAVIKINGDAIIMQPGIYKSQRQYRNTDKNTERKRLKEQLELINYRLIEIKESEWRDYRLKRKMLKQRTGIKNYPNKNLDYKHSHKNSTHHLVQPSIRNNWFYSFAISEKKLKSFEKLQGYSYESITQMTDSEIKNLSSNLRYNNY